ncbi:hypothetical protein BaRGS_00023205, partial [Batillaria attramentaria]
MGYTTGQAVYADDSLSLTCEVSGGKPLVTSVTFACQSPHPDNLNDVTASGSVSSSLDVSLTQHDDNVTCSCTARWKVASYYRDSADTTLTVYCEYHTDRTQHLLYTVSITLTGQTQHLLYTVSIIRTGQIPRLLYTVSITQTGQIPRLLYTVSITRTGQIPRLLYTVSITQTGLIRRLLYTVSIAQTGLIRRLLYTVSIAQIRLIPRLLYTVSIAQIRLIPRLLYTVSITWTGQIPRLLYTVSITQTGLIPRLLYTVSITRTGQIPRLLYTVSITRTGQIPRLLYTVSITRTGQTHSTNCILQPALPIPRGRHSTVSLYVTGSLPFPYLESNTVLSLYVTDNLPFPYQESDTVLSVYVRESLPFPYLESNTVLSLYVTDNLPFPYLEGDTVLSVYVRESLPFPYLEGDTLLSVYVRESLPFPYLEGDTVLSVYVRESLPFPYLEGDTVLSLLPFPNLKGYTVLSLYVTDSLPFPYLEGDISVTDPPSTPAISRTDNLPFPFLEGDTVRLSCDLQSRGKPTANLTWSGHGNGQITNPDGAPATLVMTSVGKKDNNRNITCRTSNAWTQYKGQDISYGFPLQVYYSPQIRMTSREGSNRCQLIENIAQCVVVQGQRVHFTCSADSNPPPATIVWRKNNSQDGDLDIGVGPDIDIQSANHTKHNGNFSCHVTTGNLQGTGRTRNPLTSSDQLTVLVKYIPERSSLFLSHVTGSLTVSEGDDVVLACLADGRPTPDMTLVKKETGSRVHYVKGGVLVVEDRDSWLNYTITSAQCSNTGTYTCTTRNDVGTGPETSGAIFVNCKPRSPSPPPVDVPSVNYVNQSVHLTFNLWALPVPDRYEILYLGPFRNDTAVRRSGIAFDVQCIVTGELYNISCDVTVVNVTDDTAAGFYQLNVTNTHGDEQLVFQVKYNGHTTADAPNVHRGEYEEVGIKGDTPLIAPAATKSSASAEDVGPLYSKSKAKSEQNQKDSDTLYSSVDKSRKTGLTSSGDAVSGKGEIKAKPAISSKPDVKPKPPKDDKPAKVQKNKGKAKQMKGPVYGNMMPLSMRPMEASVYENYAFSSEEALDQS